MIEVCPPICDSLYFSFWARFTTDFMGYLDQLLYDVSDREKLFSVFRLNQSIRSLELTTAEDENADFMGYSRGLKGYTKTVASVRGIGRNFNDWTMGICRAEIKPELAVGDPVDLCSRRNPHEYHRVTVVLGSGYMHSIDHAGGTAEDALQHWLDNAFQSVIDRKPRFQMININRIDIACDHWGCEWSIFDLPKFVCSARTQQAGKNAKAEKVETDDGEICVHTIGSKNLTLYVGMRGSKSRFLRIYDKVGELEDQGTKKKIAITNARWRAYNWDGEQRVWRMEIEHGAEWLKDHGFTNATKLKGCERELFDNYMVNNQHKCVTKKKLRANKPSLRWRKLMKASSILNAGVWEYEKRERGVGTADQLVKMAAGLIDNLAEQQRSAMPVKFGGLDTESLEKRRIAALEMILERLKEKDQDALNAAIKAAQAEPTLPRTRNAQYQDIKPELEDLMNFEYDKKGNVVECRMPPRKDWPTEDTRKKTG